MPRFATHVIDPCRVGLCDTKRVTMEIASRDLFVVLLLLLSSVLSNSATVSYDPNIECDTAELTWKYAQKLMPSRGTFPSVYDAVNLKKCNISDSISEHVESDPAPKRRYTSTSLLYYYCLGMQMS